MILDQLWVWRWEIQRWWFSILPRKRCWYCGRVGRFGWTSKRPASQSPQCSNDPACFARKRDQEVFVGKHGTGLEYKTGFGQRLINVHAPESCAELRCVIHNPSNHALSDRPTWWRYDRQIMERICEHGIGHPDPDDAAFRASRGDTDTVHGCDGCCISRCSELRYGPELDHCVLEEGHDGHHVY